MELNQLITIFLGVLTVVVSLLTFIMAWIKKDLGKCFNLMEKANQNFLEHVQNYDIHKKEVVQ